MHLLIVLATSVVYSLGVMWFLTPANLYAAGITGVSQIVMQMIQILFDVDIPLGVFTFYSIFRFLYTD